MTHPSPLVPRPSQGFSLVELSTCLRDVVATARQVVLVKKAASFSGVTRESKEHGKEILASGARMTTLGFSLVELSIVLVILGLLTGGILTGQNLIRNAELRSVTMHLQQIETAAYTFRDKYFALPGDMPNAEDFWGEAHATPATCAITASTGTETCNGDGDGQVEQLGVGTPDSNEVFRFWQHLANAGLVEGSYSGIAGAGANHEVIPGTNALPAKLGQAGYSLTYPTIISGNAHMYDGSYTHRIIFGAFMTAKVNKTPVITPEEAWNIDTKIDDGKPADGQVMSWKSTSVDTPNCTTTDVVSTAEYNVSNSAILCSFMYMPGF